MAPKGILKIKFFLPLQMIFWHLAQSAVFCKPNQSPLIRTAARFYSPEHHPNSALRLKWTSAFFVALSVIRDAVSILYLY